MMLILYLLICVLATDATRICKQDDYYEFMTCLYDTVIGLWNISPELDPDLKALKGLQKTKILLLDKTNYSAEFLDYTGIVRSQILRGDKLSYILLL